MVKQLLYIQVLDSSGVCVHVVCLCSDFQLTFVCTLEPGSSKHEGGPLDLSPSRQPERSEKSGANRPAS